MSNDYLECKICGGKYKSLLRHVSGAHKDISIEEYMDLDPRPRYTADSTNKLLSDHLSERNKEMWKDPEFRESKSKSQSKLMKDLMDSGKITKDMCIKNSRSTKKTLYYNGDTYRSSWEIKFAKHLNSLGIEFEYECYSSEYQYNNKMRSYFPDFYLPNYNVFIEIHPKDLVDEIMELKLNSIDNIILITEDELFNDNFDIRNYISWWYSLIYYENNS